MMQVVLGLAVILASAAKLINYGRWAGSQGNLRGMIGLYITAAVTVAMPVGVYLFKQLAR